jgi:predicted SprT family Zn-dependent metalloprotease
MEKYGGAEPEYESIAVDYNRLTKKGVRYLLQKDMKMMKNLLINQAARMEEGVWLELLRL